MDLVEIAATAVPPVCRLVDFGKFRYELAKKEKESKKHQHASTVKEVQLSPRIDPHDLGIKVMHAVNFLCEDMKVKVALKFRGREMAHTEIGFEVINILDAKNQVLQVTAPDSALLPTLLQPLGREQAGGSRVIESGTGVTLNYDTVGTFSGGQKGGERLIGTTSLLAMGHPELGMARLCGRNSRPHRLKHGDSP